MMRPKYIVSYYAFRFGNMFYNRYLVNIAIELTRLGMICYLGYLRISICLIDGTYNFIIWIKKINQTDREILIFHTGINSVE
jgi:hypothetical protein